LRGANAPHCDGASTMKLLTLIRHAKSSWDDPMLTDRDRPLNKRGKRDAPTMGKRLAQRGAQPDAIVSSPAVRARETAEAIAREIAYPREAIQFDERLYGADPFEWLQVVQGLDDSLERVMCLGHNPGLTDFVNTLSPRPIDNVPTCGVVAMRFDVNEWRRVGKIRPTHVDLDAPKKTE